MKKIMLLTGVALMLSGVTVSAKEPIDEPPTPEIFPIPELSGFPPAIAKQLTRDMQRVQQEVKFATRGAPFQAPLPFEMPKKFRFDVPVIPQLPELGHLPLGEFSTSDQESSSWSCVNGKFTMSHRKNDVCYKVKGCIKDGVAVPEGITVNDGKESTSFENIDDMPACHRKVIQKLLEKE